MTGTAWSLGYLEGCPAVLGDTCWDRPSLVEEEIKKNAVKKDT